MQQILRKSIFCRMEKWRYCQKKSIILDTILFIRVYVYDKCVSKYPEMSAVSPPLGVCQPEILSSYPGRGDCNLFV